MMVECSGNEGCHRKPGGLCEWAHKDVRHEVSELQLRLTISFKICNLIPVSPILGCLTVKVQDWQLLCPHSRLALTAEPWLCCWGSCPGRGAGFGEDLVAKVNKDRLSATFSGDADAQQAGDPRLGSGTPSRTGLCTQDRGQALVPGPRQVPLAVDETDRWESGP